MDYEPDCKPTPDPRKFCEGYSKEKIYKPKCPCPK